ncbi:replication factor C subunit 1 [Dermatophagoides pteronyssinus]|uniref:Replication factor C subunit 1 n=1 Tax=Dermatophagoides pteronyssinus TaxID=6956 RepID=A0ABQ8J133_DERPT|nr:replication factor C subunit 1 [Dermatophagoides pteronyssinus]
MNSIKKRKHPIVDVSDEDDDDFNRNSRKHESKSRKKSAPELGKKKLKRIVLESSSDEDNNVIDTNISDSINDIKKDAKIRARNLAAGKADLDVGKSSASKSKSPKISPPDQKNKILNYFKPKNIDSNEVKQEVKKQSNETKKVETKITDDDGYTYTTVKPYKSSSTTTKINKHENSDHIKKSNDKNSHTNESVEKKMKQKIDDSLDKKSQIKDVEKTKEKLADKTGDNMTAIITKSSNKESPRKSDNQLNNNEKVIKVKESPSKNKLLKQEKSPKKSKLTSLPRIVETQRVSELWVDKYKPTSVKQVIGQQGDRSSLNKLIKWLRNWHSNIDKKPGFGKWGPDDGAGFRAALLSGPPGIGKTTTAQLVCKELGYDYLELNASDQRNKKSLHENVRDLLKNTKLTDFFKSTTNTNDHDDRSIDNEQKLTSKHCLIMDEVDGVSGNADRGGIAELIQLIKSTMIPIICICNDRGDQKMRSLVNHCFDLRFHKPKLEQIKATLMSIVFKEKMKIAPDVLDDLIVSSNFDIRQCIHNLYLLSIQQSSSPKVSKLINNNQEKPIKDVRLTPFEAIRKVFCTGRDYALMSLDDKSNLFFCDYSIMPLFVYENYISINLSSKQPSVGKQLKRLYKSIDSISQSDLIEKEIRSNQSWSLLPLQAIFSTVMPGSYMRSENGLGCPQFPQFMGKLSTTNKNNRIIEELSSHLKLSVNGSKQSIIMDYLEPIKNTIINSLKNLDKESAITNVIDLLENYSLTKEDMNSILEFCVWLGEQDPMKTIDSKMKAALTRAYNKKDFTLPYARDSDCRNVTTTKSGRKKGKNKNDLDDGSQDESMDDQFNDDNDNEVMDFY